MPEAFEELIAEIGADLSGLDRGLRDARTRIDDFQRGVGRGPSPSSPFDRLGETLGKVGKEAEKLGKSLIVGVTLPIAAVAAAVVKFGSDFESAFAGVRKTVNATEPEFAALRAGIRDLSKEIPIAATELANIAEAAGQLGIKKDQILAFTRTMADLGVSTNLTSTEAATMLARFGNITGLARDAEPAWSNLGSTIVDLGNNFATTEREITEMGLRLAGAGTQIKLTEAQILGIATALSSVGIESEAGGTAFSRVMLNMQSAVKTGGAELANFAKVAGLSASEFKNAFETDAAGAIVLFVEGLKRMSDQGANLMPILGGLELGEIRVRDALLRTANAGDLLRNSIDLGTKAWSENTALTKEAEQRYKTFESQITLLKNQVIDVAITLFDKFRPALVSIVDRVKDFAEGLGKLNPAILEMGVAAAGVAASAGPLALLAGKLLALGPKGLAIIAVIAGAAAMAAAYKKDFGAMQKTLDDFAKHLSNTLGLAKKDMGDFATFAAQIASGLATEFDAILSVLNSLLNAVRTTVETTIAAVTLQWEKIPGIIERGLKQEAEIEASFFEREEKRRKERYILQIEGYKGLMDRLRITSEKGAEGIRTSFDKHMKDYDPLEGFRANILKTEDQIIQDTLTFGRKFQTTVENILIDVDKQKLYREAQEIGFAIGSGVTQGNRAGLEKKSPTRVERDILEMSENVIKILTDGAGKASGAAKKYAEAIKEAFDTTKAWFDAYIQAIGGLGVLTVRIWESLGPVVRKSVDEQTRHFERLRDFVNELNVRFALLGTGATAAMEGMKVSIKSGTIQMISDVDNLSKTINTKMNFNEVLAHVQKVTPEIVNSWEEILVRMRIIQDARYTEIIEKNKGALEKIIEDLKRFHQEMDSIWGKGFADLLRTLSSWTGESQKQINKWATGVFEVLDALPGEWGKRLNKAANEVVSWVNRIDQILRGLHKIFDGIPEGLGKAIEKIAGIFKNKSTLDEILDATGVFGEVGAKSGEKFGEGFLGKIKGIFSGKGGIGGIISNFLGIGGIIGGVVGLFKSIFGGKSDAEKAAEEQAKIQLEGARAGVVKALEESKQAMLQTASQAAALFEQLLFFTKVPRKTIKQFVQNLGELFTFLADELQRLTPQALEKIKSASEALKPAAELLAAMPLVFEGINRHIGVADRNVETYFADLDKVVERLGISAEATPNKLEKQIKKFSERLKPAAELLSGITSALKDMFDLKRPPVENFQIISDALDEISVMVGELGERMGKRFVKELEFFASKAIAGVAFWREGIAVVKEMVDIPRPTEADFKSLFSSLETGLNESIALAARLAGDAFDNSVLFWERAKVLFETVRAGMDIVNAISEIQQVGKDKWEIWVGNIQMMVDALMQSVGLAEHGVDLSLRFFDATRSIYDNIKLGVGNLADAVRAANEALASLSQIGEFATAGAGLPGAPVRPLLPSGNVTNTTNTGNTYVFNGITLTREQARNMTVEELADGLRTGARVGGGLR